MGPVGAVPGAKWQWGMWDMGKDGKIGEKTGGGWGMGWDGSW